MITVRRVFVGVLAALAMGPAAHAGGGWQGAIGGGVFAQPVYPGSSRDRARPVPLVSGFSPESGVYAGSSLGGGSPLQFGVVPIRSRHWLVGLDVSGQWRDPRLSSDDPLLSGLPNIERTAFAGLFVRYRIRGFSALIRSDSDILHKEQGTLLTLSASYRWHVTPTLSLSAGPVLHWANSQRAQTYFGITPQQSLASGLPEYAASSGLQDAGVRVRAVYIVNPSWRLIVAVLGNGLQGDAVDSPVVEKRDQISSGVMVAYRF